MPEQTKRERMREAIVSAFNTEKWQAFVTVTDERGSRLCGPPGIDAIADELLDKLETIEAECHPQVAGKIRPLRFEANTFLFFDDGTAAAPEVPFEVRFWSQEELDEAKQRARDVFDELFDVERSVLLDPENLTDTDPSDGIYAAQGDGE